jgi:hypothetical protein
MEQKGSLGLVNSNSVAVTVEAAEVVEVGVGRDFTHT